MDINILDQKQYLEALMKKENVADYGAMYSSWVGGIVKDPKLMMIPIDDHMVHRGDAVFEAFKFVYGAFYDLKSHLNRLRASADFIGLNVPYTDSEITSICAKLMEVSGYKEAIFRLYVSRGPGDFTPNPYSTLGSQLYIIVTPLKRVPEEKYNLGCTLIKSDIPVKPSFYSRVKSCNYMQNVLMKKHSLDNNADFAVNYNGSGFLCEGPTENILILDKNNELIAPKYEYTLKGTTLEIVMGLAQKLVDQKVIHSIGQTDIAEQTLYDAKEVMMVGTTLEVLPVVLYEGVAINDGRPGPIAKKLRELLVENMKTSRLNRIDLNNNPNVREPLDRS